MKMSESIKIWVEIRDSATKLHQAGANPGEILRWSREKTLYEVKTRLHGILCECPAEQDDVRHSEDAEIRNIGDIRTNTGSYISTCKKTGLKLEINL
jgi:hypothetical protein